MDDGVEEVDHESDDDRQQHVQSHVSCFPIAAGYESDPGSMTPCEKRTSPTKKPKKAMSRSSISTVGSIRRLFLRSVLTE
jgi:hypothetical protein